MKNKTMSFSHWAMACGVIPKTKSLAQREGSPGRMHSQSKDGPVLRLRSRRALSPAPPDQYERAQLACHLKKQRN